MNYNRFAHGWRKFWEIRQNQRKIPIMMFMLGSASHENKVDHDLNGTSLPSLHSPYLAPDYQKTIETGTLVMSSSVMKLFHKD